MALNDREKRFAKGVAMGKSKKEAAVYAGYSVATASQAGSRLAKDEKIIAYIEQIRDVKEKAGAKTYDFVPDNSKAELNNIVNSKDPLAFLLDVMSDPAEDQAMRVNAARAALPYVHGKVGDVGKKESQKDNATDLASGKSGTGRFAAAKAPTKRLN